MTGPERRWVGVGDRQELTTERQLTLDEVLEREGQTAARMGVHLWVLIVAHRASDKMLDALFRGDDDTDGPPMLDVETMLAPPTVACMVCEVQYEPRLRKRKCPGDPTGRFK